MLADLDARYVRRDRLELAAVFRGRVGLQVEGVDVARAAAEVDEDRRGRLAASDRAGLGQPQVIGQPQAGRAEHADPEEIAPPDPVAASIARHVVFPPRDVRSSGPSPLSDW